MVGTHRSMSQQDKQVRRGDSRVPLRGRRAVRSGAAARATKAARSAQLEGASASAEPAKGDAAEQTRVLIADGQAPARARARIALQGRGLVVAAEAADADSAVEAARRERPDVCLLDPDLPGDGIRACAKITAACPETAVVMYTGAQTDADLFVALRAGASGYLPKTTDTTRLAFALRGVLRGEAALPRNLVTRLIEEFRSQDRRRRLPQGDRLSTREWEVLELMRQGLSTAEMATRLFVSSVTIRTHVSSIVRKLKVPDRAAAVRLLDEAS